jgi:Fic/DOC family
MLQRAEEPCPAGRLSVNHFRAIRRHLFQDVYAWAGRFRTVRISKGGSMFCYPEHIGAEMRRLFDQLKHDRYLTGLGREEFARKGAHFLAEVKPSIRFARATVARSWPISPCLRKPLAMLLNSIGSTLMPYCTPSSKASVAKRLG